MAEPSLEALVEALRRLPGVGVKSAQRMAFHLLQHDREGAQRLASTLQSAVFHRQPRRSAASRSGPSRRAVSSTS